MTSKETDLEQVEMEDKLVPLQDGPLSDLNLKRSKKEIILRPQPSDDPSDPLNWSTTKKYSTYLTVCLFAFLGLVNTSNFTVAIKPVSRDLHISTTQAGYLTSIQLLFMGLGNLFWMPALRILGKRPIYLLSLLSLVLTNIWSYYASTYPNLLASRLVGGFLAAAADATVPAVVADLFFAHERGHCMMIFHMAVSGGVFLGPLANAYIVQYAGWRWMCGGMAIAAGGVFLLAVFCVHESAYKRDGIVGESGRELRAKSWWETLSLTMGYDKEARFWTWVSRTLVLLAYPPVLIAGLTIGVFTGWNISIQLTSTRTFTAPPYNWTIHSLGLFSISGFIGALVSFFLGGHLIDLIAHRLSLRTNGTPEPEFRLPAMLIPALIGPTGVLTFGLVIAFGKSWLGAAVGFAMLGFGLTAASNVIVTYCIDAYRPISGEVLVIIFVVRNAMGCIFSLYIADWITVEGVKNAFGEMVAIMYAILGLSVVLYIWGKKIRNWTETFGPMKKVLST